MAHDKIKAAARKRMAETGEPYTLARRMVIEEHAKLKARVLSPADPEPPAGTVVRDASGCEWYRSHEGGYWLRQKSDNTDPESWTKVAGNYGPVTVLERGGDLDA